jgi:CheY-like chemotaxis protein
MTMNQPFPADAFLQAPSSASPATDVLLLEIDPFAAARIAQALRDDGYRLTLAGSLPQAVAILGAADTQFEILVADLAEAPPSSALKLLAAARHHFPDIRLICLGAPLEPQASPDVIACEDDIQSLLKAMAPARPTAPRALAVQRRAQKPAPRRRARAGRRAP